MVGIRGAKVGALRLGGVLGATALALALPVSNGIGPFGSAAPKPTEAAVFYTLAVANGSGEHETDGAARARTAQELTLSISGLDRDRTSASLYETRLVPLG